MLINLTRYQALGVVIHTGYKKCALLENEIAV